MAASTELLREKAMLLIRRERELYEFRQERRRIEVWLNVFHKLTLNLQSAVPSSLLEQWVQAMVGELTFQVAAVYDCDEPARLLRLLAGVAHVPVAPETRWSNPAAGYLAANSSGSYGPTGPAELKSLAEETDLGMFCWLLLPLRNKHLLLVAGFAAGTERFHAINADDVTHFVLLGRHLGALVSNGDLIAELDREKSELQESNRQLDVNVRRLREAQRDLVASGKRLAEVSRRAGMADMATGVLHNVGNALNSVNISAEMLLERMRGLKVAGVTRAAALVEPGSEPSSGSPGGGPRGAKLAVYLKELGTHLAEEREELLKEMTSLQEHIEHIKVIVAKQQAFATSFDTSQACRVEELVDDAIALVEHSLVKEGIAIEREYDPVAEIVVDRHKVLQILVNLLKNAQDALIDSGQPRKRIVARIAAGPGGVVRITIQDDGVGIAPEELSRLFAFGFTTKKGGHGFGLHASAIAAQELGGAVRASSAGRGTGASFTLELPPRPKSGAVSAA